MDSIILVEYVVLGQKANFFPVELEKNRCMYLCILLVGLDFNTVENQTRRAKVSKVGLNVGIQRGHLVACRTGICYQTDSLRFGLVVVWVEECKIVCYYVWEGVVCHFYLEGLKC